tara:strand:+ start:174 stop:1328 length:1155 start_codon:yes stop_codon:yes gene_type:complete
LSDSQSPPQNIVVGHHYDFIDGLRGLAVLLVIWFHASVFLFSASEENQFYHELYYRLSLIGQTGVDLFFIISGFLITGILIDTKDVENRFRRFYIRRSLRIFPLYYGFLFLMGAVLLLQPLSEDWGSDVGRFFYHSVYLQNWFSPASDGFWLLLSHTWSLAIEEQFYLLWPLIFWFLYKRSYVSTIGFCLVLIIISMYLRFDLAERGYHNFAYRATISHFDSIAMGALCSLLFCKYGQVFSRFKLILSLVALLSIAVFLLCLFSYDLKKSHLFLISNGLTFMNVAYICVFMLLLISSSENVVKKFLAKPFFIFTARISYGMYIFHFPICVFISVWVQSLDYEYLYGHFIALTLTLCLSYLVSWLSYKYFEEPILKLKDRYAPVM